jgi:hypothetical protein
LRELEPRNNSVLYQNAGEKGAFTYTRTGRSNGFHWIVCHATLRVNSSVRKFANRHKIRVIQHFAHEYLWLGLVIRESAKEWHFGRKGKIGRKEIKP